MLREVVDVTLEVESYLLTLPATSANSKSGCNNGFSNIMRAGSTTVDLREEICRLARCFTQLELDFKSYKCSFNIPGELSR